MRRFDRRKNAFASTTFRQRIERIVIANCFVLDPAYRTEKRVFRPDAGIVEPGGYRMSLLNLAVLILQQ